MTRTDVFPGTPVEQVTYGGLPLYRFLFDDAPGQTTGANMDDPVTSPRACGTWSGRAEAVPPRTGHNWAGKRARLSERETYRDLCHGTG